MKIDPQAHRAAMSALADLYFAEQCRRLGKIKGQRARRIISIKPAPRLEDYNPRLGRSLEES